MLNESDSYSHRISPQCILVYFFGFQVNYAIFCLDKLRIYWLSWQKIRSTDIPNDNWNWSEIIWMIHEKLKKWKIPFICKYPQVHCMTVSLFGVLMASVGEWQINADGFYLFNNTMNLDCKIAAFDEIAACH